MSGVSICKYGSVLYKDTRGGNRTGPNTKDESTGGAAGERDVYFLLCVWLRSGHGAGLFWTQSSILLKHCGTVLIALAAWAHGERLFKF